MGSKPRHSSSAEQLHHLNRYGIEHPTRTGQGHRYVSTTLKGDMPGHSEKQSSLSGGNLGEQPRSARLADCGQFPVTGASLQQTGWRRAWLKRLERNLQVGFREASRQGLRRGEISPHLVLLLPSCFQVPPSFEKKREKECAISASGHPESQFSLAPHRVRLAALACQYP